MKTKLEKEEKILAIDTSSPVMAVALAEGENVCWEANLSFRFRHLEKIYLLIESGLNLLGWTMQDINVIACGVGPGSFTGLRVGLSAVKGLGIVGEKKIVCVSSLDIIARNFNTEGDIAVIVDAKRDEMFAAFYTLKSGIYKKKTDDVLLSLDDFILKISRRKKPVIVLGDGVNVVSKALTRANKSLLVFADKSSWYPGGAQIVFAATDLIKKKRFVPLSRVLPEYLRLSAAEELKEKKKNDSKRKNRS